MNTLYDLDTESKNSNYLPVELCCKSQSYSRDTATRNRRRRDQHIPSDGYQGPKPNTACPLTFAWSL